MIRNTAAVPPVEEAGLSPGVPEDGTRLDVDRLLASMSADGSATPGESDRSPDDLRAAYTDAREKADLVPAVELGIRLQSAYAVAEAHAERATVLQDMLELAPCQQSPELQVVLRTKLAHTLLCEHRLTDAQAALSLAQAQVEPTGLAGGPWHAQLLEVVVRTLRASHVLGEPQEVAVRQLLDVARGSGSAEAQGRAHWLASRAIGQMEAAFAMMTERAATYEVRSGPLRDFQMTKEKIADARIRIDQFRLLTLYAAWRIDQAGHEGAREAIHAVKAALPGALQDVVQQAMHLCGAVGISSEMPLYRWLAWAQAVAVSDGPTETHKLGLADAILSACPPRGTAWPSAHIPTNRARFCHDEQ